MQPQVLADLQQVAWYTGMHGGHCEATHDEPEPLLLLELLLLPPLLVELVLVLPPLLPELPPLSPLLLPELLELALLLPEPLEGPPLLPLLPVPSDASSGSVAGASPVGSSTLPESPSAAAPSPVGVASSPQPP